MKRLANALAILLACALCAGDGIAQDATLEVSESVLNQALERISVLSDGGVRRVFIGLGQGASVDRCAPVGYICPADPNPAPPDPGRLTPPTRSEYTRIAVAVCPKALGGVAIYPYRKVAWQWWISGAHLTIASGGMTLSATVTTHVNDVWETSTRSSAATVRFDPADHRLKLDIASFTVSLGDAGTVNVARLLALAIPIEPQAASVPMPDGSTKRITGGVSSANVEYQPGVLKIKLNTVFQ